MESKPFRGKYYIKRVAYLLFHLCCDDFVIFLIHSSFSVTVSYEFIIHKRREEELIRYRIKLIVVLKKAERLRYSVTKYIAIRNTVLYI